MTKRSVATVIILSIITCGIYGLYWLYVTASELQQKSGQSTISPAILLILALLVGPVGFALFGYDAAKSMDAINAQNNTQSDKQVIYILLGVFLSIVLIGIVQNDINNLPQ